MVTLRKQTNLNPLTGDFLFKKKKKEPSELEDRPEVVNKALV